MRRRRSPLRVRGRTIPWLFLFFVLGGVTGWWIHATVSSPKAVLSPVAAAPGVPVRGRENLPAPTTTPVPIPPLIPAPALATPDEVPHIDTDPIAELRRHALRLPLDGANVEAMKGGFTERRGGGARGHEAVDILAPRSTPIRAVENGTIAKLFFSKAGGTTIYQYDPSGHFCYYYAHLERYASGLREGQTVSAGEVIGYVGTTGNASPNTPHLHFAILQLTDKGRWWNTTALDPYLVFRALPGT